MWLFFSVWYDDDDESCSVVSDSLRPHGLYSPCNSPGQDTGVGSLSLLQGIFPTQGLEPGLLHCRRILYQLSHREALSTCNNAALHFKCTGFPGGSASKESTCSVEDLGVIRGLGRSAGEENSYPLQYSGLENSMDYTVNGILQTRILEWVAFPFSRGSSQPRD